MDDNVDKLEKDKKHLNSELEEKRVEITNLQGRIKEQDQEIGSKLMEIVQMEDSMDDLRDQLEDVWTSYHNDREWWKQRADKVLGWVMGKYLGGRRMVDTQTTCYTCHTSIFA